MSWGEKMYIFGWMKKFLKHGKGCQSAQTGVVYQQLYEELYWEQIVM